jgi:hypothetical protein
MVGWSNAGHEMANVPGPCAASGSRSPACSEHGRRDGRDGRGSDRARARAALLIVLPLLAAFAVAAATGARYGLLLLIGLGFGIVLEGLRFGFAGPWRAMILRRDPSGLWRSSSPSASWRSWPSR